MGPDCRARHGLEDGNEVNRQEANRLVHQLALWRGSHELAPSAEDAVRLLRRLKELGFEKLADVLTQRLATLHVWESRPAESLPATSLLVRTTAKPTFIAAVKRLGGRWAYESKAWRLPILHRQTLWGVLKAEFPGEVGVGPRGPFATPEPRRAVQTSLGLELTH
jgi:hypothetical protein